jgi:putative transposase
LLPVLYLRGISTGDFQEAMSALLGTDAPNLSPAVISRLTAEWKEEYTRWQKRDLSARHYGYAWADGVYLQARIKKEYPRTRQHKLHGYCTDIARLEV